MNAVPDTLIMKGELSLEKRCILNWDHGTKIEYLEEKGKKQSLKLYLVSHGDRYGGFIIVPGGSSLRTFVLFPTLLHSNKDTKKPESSFLELSDFFTGDTYRASRDTL